MPSPSDTSTRSITEKPGKAAPGNQAFTTDNDTAANSALAREVSAARSASGPCAP